MSNEPDEQQHESETQLPEKKPWLLFILVGGYALCAVFFLAGFDAVNYTRNPGDHEWSNYNSFLFAFFLLLGICYIVSEILARLPKAEHTEAEEELEEAEVKLPVCYRCCKPQKTPHYHICEHCGASSGPYNNTMPYLWIQNYGDYFRAGVNKDVNTSWFNRLGLYLISFCAYTFFAPLYWIRMGKNLERIRQQDVEGEAEPSPPEEIDADQLPQINDDKNTTEKTRSPEGGNLNEDP